MPNQTSLPRRERLIVTQALTAAPGDVWRLLTAGTRVEQWFPWVAATIVDSPAEGGSRRIQLQDGTSFLEYILLNDAPRLTYQYYAPAPPLPIQHVIGTQRIELEPAGAPALSWFVTFDVLPTAPADIVSRMRELYQGALIKLDTAARGT